MAHDEGEPDTTTDMRPLSLRKRMEEHGQGTL
jgi:hypothetical protein